MILVGLNHASGTIQERGEPLRFPAETAIVMVGFYVSLIYNINPILITEFVPLWIVRVMCAAHRVEVMLFHQPDVLQHRFPADSFSVKRIVFMAVHSLYQNGPAIDEQFPVFDFNPAEANFR
jgi:hypothetical protein